MTMESLVGLVFTFIVVSDANCIPIYQHTTPLSHIVGLKAITKAVKSCNLNILYDAQTERGIVLPNSAFVVNHQRLDG